MQLVQGEVAHQLERNAHDLSTVSQTFIEIFKQQYVENELLRFLCVGELLWKVLGVY